VHNPSVLRTATSFSDLEDMYGAENLTPPPHPSSEASPTAGLVIKLITLAPELSLIPMCQTIIPTLVSRGIVVSIGHSDATYAEASGAVSAGASMVTHLLNAMRPFHQREPGIFGVLAGSEVEQESGPFRLATEPEPKEGPGRPQHRLQQPGGNKNTKRPYFGLVCDGIHLHPATVRLASRVYPDGMILVTDAMHVLGLPDGRYEWTNGDGENCWLVKRGRVCTAEGTGGIAGR
jgi:N-acetylglucosamine-6-phosphate deacetylase